MAITPLAFFALFAVWLYLPFREAICELLEFGDCEPVRVVPNSEVDIRHHAQGYRAFLSRHLQDAITRGDQENAPQPGRLQARLNDDTELVTEYLVLPGSPEDDVPKGDRLTPCAVMVVSNGRLVLPSDSAYSLEVYARGVVMGGDRTVYRAILSDDRIELGPDSRTFRWLHAADAVRLGAGCVLHGRVSADRLIELGDRCRFERLRAPTIRFGPAGTGPRAPAGTRRVAPDDVPGLVDVQAGRWLVRGDLSLPDASLVEADVVATGCIEVGAGSEVRGSVKSGRDLRLGPEVAVTGSVVSGRDSTLEPGCQVGGPMLAERFVWIETGCRLGGPDEPTTVSARRVWVRPGCVVHGEVWSHEVGAVDTEWERPEA